MLWNCISESVRGAQHKKNGLPLQDAIMSMSDKDYFYVAVSDGHGSPLCFRSDIGASLACFSAINIIKHHSRSIVNLKNKDERELACRNVIQAINAHWTRLVLENLKANPFSSEELDDLKDEHKKNLSGNALLAYGTTVSLAVLNRNLIFGFCLGDGDAIFMLKNKIELFKDSSENKGEETDSLCIIESLANARYFENKTSNTLCFMLSTDGYRKSFESDKDFESVITDLYNFLLENGEEKLRNELKPWLDETSIKGSGDDISACFLYNSSKVKIQ